jgi:RES domain
MRLSYCRLLPRRPLTGTWFRAIRPQFLQTSLAYHHTTTIPGRFNAGSTQRPGFPVLYLAEDQLVALFEVNALLGSPFPGQVYLPSPHASWLVVHVNVQWVQLLILPAFFHRFEGKGAFFWQ